MNSPGDSAAEPQWLTVAFVEAAHSEQLAIFGGPSGVRDRGLLEGALGRAMNKWAYGERDLAILAAAYGFGISRSHPFIDGNKRTAFTAILVFLRLNGVMFRPSASAATETMLALAAGDLDESRLGDWVRASCEEPA